MVNVAQLEERLKDNYELIIKILIELNFDEDYINIREQQNLITARRPEEGADNPNGCLVYVNTLNVIFTTRAWSGNIFSLVMKLKETTFSKALEYIQKWIGFTVDNVPVVKPFHGFYKQRIHDDFSFLNPSFQIITDDELPPPDSLSDKFAKDGVAASVQQEWGVRYDHENNAVLIPIYDYSGNLVGCKARNNDPNCDPTERFWALKPYPKSMVVYGWFQNFKTISEKQMVIIVESEKGVLQAASFGCNILVGIGGHNISKTQAHYIKMLGAKTIIVAFDEGISEEEIRQECKKLENHNSILYNNISYIFDRDNRILKKGSKNSPVDHGSKCFKELLKDCRFKL